MNIPLDIHTHRLPQVPGEAIVNCSNETFFPQEGGWYSVGIHPWTIPALCAGREDSFLGSRDLYELESHLKVLASHPQVLAVGESGLDKLTAAPLSLQIALFKRQALLAMETGKPLVIHLVRAVAELLALKRTLRPTNPWIIHGFRGKAALAEDYLRHGFFLSFGEKFQEEALRLTPVDRLFVETDESNVGINELYERLAAVRGVSPEEFKKSVKENIVRAFFNPILLRGFRG